MNFITIIPVFLPIFLGALMFKLNIQDRKKREKYVSAVLGATLLLTIITNFIYFDQRFTLMTFSAGLDFSFKADSVAVLFSSIFAIIFLLVGIYSFEYIKHDGDDNRFFAFYIATLGALIGIAYADNLFTMYLFYEMLSILSFALVMHTKTKESIAAAKKYIYYSLFGAALGLIGIFYFYSIPSAKGFEAGGVLLQAGLSQESLALVPVFVIIAVIGFGCKAGMFPLHGWLPTAHPLAPAPASSVLSGVITKAGIIAIIRVVFFTVGADIIRGSIAQYVILGLCIITIFIGSMLAYKENVLKKRLAYSTVSQVSYVIFGLFILNEVAAIGALLQVVFHALAKNTLFLCAGAIIYKTHKTKCSELIGMGKQMPKTFTCFTIAGLSLVGIPFFAGFVSKWYIATGALLIDSKPLSTIAFIGVCVLMISALLTAGYLLVVSAKAFFNENDTKKNAVKKVENKEANNTMLIPIGILTCAIIYFGIRPTELIDFISTVVQSFGM